MFSIHFSKKKETVFFLKIGRRKKHFPGLSLPFLGGSNVWGRNGFAMREDENQKRINPPLSTKNHVFF